MEEIIKNIQQLNKFIKGKYVVVDEGYHVIIHPDDIMEFPADILVFGKLSLAGADKSICRSNHNDLVVYSKKESICNIEFGVFHQLSLYLTDSSVAVLHGYRTNSQFENITVNMFGDSRFSCEVNGGNIGIITRNVSQARIVCDNSSVNLQCLDESSVVVLSRKSNVEIGLRNSAKVTIDADDLSTISKIN